MSVKTLPGSSKKAVAIPMVLLVVLLAIVVGVYLSSNMAALGFKPAATPPLSEATNAGMPAVFSKPSLTATQIDKVLCAVHSSACGTGQALYDGSVQSGVNDLFAMGVFRAQSDYGTLGTAVAAKSIGDFSQHGQFISYKTWQDGYTDFYQRVAKTGEQSPQSVLDYLYISGPINPLGVQKQRQAANEPDINLVVATMKALEK